jgi:circadian clock protein KaiB
MTASSASPSPDDGEVVHLHLYVTGNTALSRRAIMNLKRFCERHLRGRHTLEVVDVSQQPQLTRDEQIIAAPTLVKRLPPPARRLIGDLSNEEKALKTLGVESSAPDAERRR